MLSVSGILIQLIGETLRDQGGELGGVVVGDLVGERGQAGERGALGLVAGVVVDLVVVVGCGLSGTSSGTADVHGDRRVA